MGEYVDSLVKLQKKVGRKGEGNCGEMNVP